MTELLVGGSKIESRIFEATQKGTPALAAFITGGFPDRENFGDALERIADAADVIEIGIPFTDPMADGITIQRASHEALANGTTLPWILDTIGSLELTTPILLMSYLNPLIARGFHRVAAHARDAGVSGMIIPDLPFEESIPIQQVMAEHGLALTQLVAPNTPQDRLETVCNASRGFVYAVATMGTTGGSSPDQKEVKSYLENVKQAAAVPVLAGFGIRTPRDVTAVCPPADGVIVGSAVIEVLERGEDPGKFLTNLRRDAGDLEAQ